jgi:serine/threonine-protein phosphatase 2B catalytic subunit
LTTLTDSIGSKSRRKPESFGKLISDVLCSDPADNTDGHLDQDYISNPQRGCSYVFGTQALGDFLTRNKLLSLIRGHEVQLEGYKMHHWQNKNFPQAITIFSAPNYCNSYNNKGAVIKFKVHLPEQRSRHSAI